MKKKTKQRRKSLKLCNGGSIDMIRKIELALKNQSVKYQMDSSNLEIGIENQNVRTMKLGFLD